MDVLSSRTLLRSADPRRSREFYGGTLGLAIHREFGDPANPGTVYFLGGGLLEVSGAHGVADPATPDGAGAAPPVTTGLWLQVRDLAAEHDRLVQAGVSIVRAPLQEPWGLLEMWIEDPDGLPIVLVEVPADHPLRRDQR